MVQVRINANGELDELVARYAAANPEQVSTRFTRLRIERTEAGLRASNRDPRRWQRRFGWAAAR
jgi:hypothetical protein